MTAHFSHERRRLQELYAAMTDGELEKLASEEDLLTDDAWDALENELDRRGLSEKIENLPAPAHPQSSFQQLATVREFRDLPIALLAQGCLQSAGIECSLGDANIVRMDWFYSNVVGGIKLRVRPEDMRSALEILNQPIPAGFNVEGVGIYEQPSCPSCSSLDITFEELDKPIAYASLALSIPLPVHNQGWKCHSCGNEWMDDVPASGND